MRRYIFFVASLVLSLYCIASCLIALFCPCFVILSSISFVIRINLSVLFCSFFLLKLICLFAGFLALAFYNHVSTLLSFLFTKSCRINSYFCQFFCRKFCLRRKRKSENFKSAFTVKYILTQFLRRSFILTGLHWKFSQTNPEL